MPDKITYYAIVDDESTVEQPSGLLRRLEFDGDGFTDEGLRQDFSWDFTPLIVEWEHGSFPYELVEVSHEQAGGIIKHFREKWGAFGQAADS
jgi:hypothetical protein